MVFDYHFLVLDDVDYFVELEVAMQVERLTSPLAILRCKQDVQNCHRGRTSTEVGIKEESGGKKAGDEEKAVVVEKLRKYRAANVSQFKERKAYLFSA